MTSIFKTYPPYSHPRRESETVNKPGPIPGTRPPELGDETLRVEDLIAWLEGFDPLKEVRIVMKTKDTRVASEIFTIEESAETVDIFPTKMPNYKDLRSMLLEKSKASGGVLRDPDHPEDQISDDTVDEAQTILNAIRKRKKAKADADSWNIQTKSIREKRNRERLRGAE